MSNTVIGRNDLGLTIETFNNNGVIDPNAGLVATSVAITAITELPGSTNAQEALQALATGAGSSGVSPADLISTAAGKGASMVGIQDAGGFYTGVTAEAALQEIGTTNASQTTAIALKQTIADPSVTTLSSGHVVAATLTDAATATAPVISDLKHASSGTAAAGFGMSETKTLVSSTGVARIAAAINTTWVTATNAAEDALVTLQAMRGGAPTTVATLSGANASGNYPFALPVTNADGVAMAFTKAGDQEVHKAGSGNMYIRSADHANSVIGFGGQQYLGFISFQREVSSFQDMILGQNIDPGVAATDGYVWLPAVGSTGDQTGVPANSGGFFAAKVPMIVNAIDSKLWIRFGGTWKSVTFT